MTTGRDGSVSGKTTTTDGAAPGVYAGFVIELLTAQDSRKASLEQRGLAVITTSGTLVTILFALVALLTKSTDYKLPASTHNPIFAALGFFAAAGVLALVTNLPMRYGTVAPSTVLAEAQANWTKTAPDALASVTATRLKLLDQARKANKWKARLLVTAMGCEVAAVVALSIAVGRILG